MTAVTRKPNSHPKLNKSFIAKHDGWDFYSVDTSAVRTIAHVIPIGYATSVTDAPREALPISINSGGAARQRPVAGS